MNCRVKTLLTGCTILLLVMIGCVIQFPSVDLTTPKQFYGTLIILGMVVIWFVLLVYRSESTDTLHASVFRHVPSHFLVTLTYFAYMAIRSLSDGAPLTTRELLRISPGIILAVVWWSVVLSRKQHTTIYSGFASVSGILAAGGIFQWLGLDSSWNYAFQEGVFSTIGHPNMLAPFLVTGMVVSLALGITARHRFIRYFWYLLMALNTFCLLLTASKGAWLGAIIAGVLLVVTGNLPRVRYGVLAALIAISLIACVYCSVAEIKPARILSDFSLRPAIWKDTLTIPQTPAQWLLGTGPGTWFIHFPEARSPQFLPRFRRCENVRHAHCEYLEQLTESGIIGLILFLGVILSWCRWMLSRYKNKRATLLETAVLFSVIAIAFQGIVSVNFRSFSVWMLFWFLLGTGYSHSTSETDQQSNDVIASLRWILILFALTGFGILWHGVTVSYGIMHSASCQYQGQIQMGSGRKDIAIECLNKAITWDPCNLDATYDLAVTNYETGRYADSEQLFRQIQTIAPDFQRIHMNLAVLYLDWSQSMDRQDLLQTAHNEITREISLNDLDENYYLLGVIEAARGNSGASHNAFLEFLMRMDTNRKAQKTLCDIRGSDPQELVRPSNWDLLLQMERYARQQVNRDGS